MQVEGPPGHNKRIATTVIVLAGVVIGFVGGTAAGGLWLVPEGSGMAGPVIALAYGLAGAVIGAFAGWLLSRRLQQPLIRRVAWGVGCVGGALAIAIAWGLWSSHTETEAALADAYARLPEFELQITRPGSETLARFSYVTNQGLQAETGSDACGGKLDGPQRVALLTAIRNVESLVTACEPREGHPLNQIVRWGVVEAQGGPTVGEIRANASCLAAYPQTNALLRTAAELAASVGCRNTR